MSLRPGKLTTILLITVLLIHLSCTPYTKVEESFNLQATHDILTYGFSWNNSTSFLKQNYDHVEFPGSVPRTFVGAVVLAGLTTLSRLLPVGKSADDMQFLVRAILGLTNAASLLALRNAIGHSFGTTAAAWYMVLQASQFHVMYYASRTLPNMFAFALTTFAFRDFVYGLSAEPGKARAWYRQSLFFLTFAGVVFRAEIAVLVLSLSVFLVGINPSSLTSIVIPAGLVGAILGLLTTVSIDSYFWQQFPIWPELQGFYYNTVLGKSSDWGVSSPNYYFNNAIPRLLLNPITYVLLIPLAVFQPATRSRSLALLLPSLGFVFIYSFLPHKEWRFIIYIIPALTAVASIGASWIWTRRAKFFAYRILAAILLVSVLGSFIASAGLLAISRLNYPGGEAIVQLREVGKNEHGTIHVHADNLACQTGLTRFLEDHINGVAGDQEWIFDKTEAEQRLASPLFWDQFDYVLAESPERAIGKWQIVDIIRGYGGVKFVQPGKMLDDRAFEERFQGGRMIHLQPWEQKWIELGEWARVKFTRGWWVVIKMEPKLRILKKQKTPINTVVEEV